MSDRWAKGRIALITGATSGFGLAAGERLQALSLTALTNVSAT